MKLTQNLYLHDCLRQFQDSSLICFVFKFNEKTRLKFKQRECSPLIIIPVIKSLHYYVHKDFELQPILKILTISKNNILVMYYDWKNAGWQQTAR